MASGQIISWGTSAHRIHLVPSGGTFVQISAGYDHGLALRADGTLAAWGGFESVMCSTCGQGTVPADNLVTDAGYTAISAGECFNLALRADGSIFARGWNDRGQTSSIPDNDATASGFIPYISVKAGGHHGVGLKADGTARAWGGTGVVGPPYSPGTQGQLPAGTPGQPFLAIGAGHRASYLIKPDRSLVQWGGACAGTPPTNIKWAVADGGYSHSYGLSTKGNVFAWINPNSCDPSNYGMGVVPAVLDNAVVSMIAPGNSNWHNIVIIP